MAPPPVRINPDDIVRIHTTERFRRLDTLERFVTTEQYKGRPSFWNDNVPLFKRGPCIVYPIVGTAIESHVSLVLNKCPVITSAPDEDDTDEDDEFGLGEDDSKQLDTSIRKIGKIVRLHTVAKALLRAGMGQSTAVAIPAVRNGRLVIDTTLAKWCTPTFDKQDPRVVTKLEIRYPYIRTETDEKGKPKKTAMLFRREIDQQNDTTYEPVEAPARKEVEPTWKPAQVVQHGLGFCPVVWYRYMPEQSTVAEFDGKAIHARLLDEVEGMDFAISQRHRAVLYQGDPITIEIGVEKGHNPTEETGVTAWHEGDAEANKDYRQPRPMDAALTKGGRKRGPGTVWQYPANDGKTDVRHLTLPESAVGAMTANAADLENKIAEALHWMPIDPKTMMSGATLSGRALEWLHKKQVNYCDDVRADFADNCLLPLVDMLLRIALAYAQRSEEWFYLPGKEALVKLLTKFNRQQKDRMGGVRETWIPPHLSVKFAPYFTPSDADKKVTSDMTRADLQAGVIKLETAVKQVAPFYDIEAPAQYAEDIEKAAAEKVESLQQAQAQLAAAAGKAPPGAAPAPPPKAGKPAVPVTQNGKRKKAAPGKTAVA